MEEALFYKLLDYYHISLEEYDYLTRPLTVNDIKDPYLFKGMDEAIKICHDAIKNNKKIMVYGDYDCDGIMSCSIIVKTFQMLNKNIGYYIPSRYIDGYGITLEKARLIVEKKYDLVILCDNGIVAFEPINYLKENNVQVIVIDHHQQGDILPKADVIIHPFISNFSFIATSAGFCSFMFSYALLNKVDEYLLILGALSIISDMMPLKDFNRDLVRLASSIYQPNKFLQIDLLKENDEFDYMSMSMKMAPKINAVGRLLKTTKINELVKFLTSNDKSTILKIYKDIDSCNENRKFIASNIQLNMDDISQDIIISIYDIEEGMVGLIANKILSTYQKPTIILTYDTYDKNILRGSMRVPQGYDVINILKQCDDLLDNYGGHPFAGGLTLKKENFEKLKEKIFSICQNILPQEEKINAITINVNDINLSNCLLINSFAPFGEGFKAPILKLENIKTSFLKLSKNQKHIITKTSLTSQIVCFNIDKDLFLNNNYVDLYGTMHLYKYHNVTNVQFLINKYFLNHEE